MSDYSDVFSMCADANRIAARLRGEKYVRPSKPKCHKPKTIKPAVTAAQIKVLDYMREFLALNDEIPPYWAIAKHFGWASITSASDHVFALGAKGLIERNEIGNWRFVREEKQ